MTGQQTDKQLYFFKLQADYFKRNEVRILEKMENGKEYSLFYLKIMIESLATNGYLRLSEEIPYNESMLAAITDTNVDIVRGALKACNALGLLEILEDATIYFRDVELLTGSVADNPNAERQRRFKARKKAEKAFLQSQETGKIESVTKSNASVTDERYQDNEEYRYIDNRLLEKEKEKEREKEQAVTPAIYTQESSKKEKKKKDIPSLDEVKQYCINRCLPVDPVRFWTYYQSIGWKKVEDWQSRLEYWAINQKQTREGVMNPAPLPPTPKGYRRDGNGNLYLINTSSDVQLSDPLADLAEILEGATT